MWPLKLALFSVAAVRGQPDSPLDPFDKVSQCLDPDDWGCDELSVFSKNHGESIGPMLKCLDYDKYDSPSEYRKEQFNEDVKDNVTLVVEVNKIIGLYNADKALSVDVTVAVNWHDSRLGPPDYMGCFEPEEAARRTPLDNAYWDHVWFPRVELDALLGVDHTNGLSRSSQLTYMPNGTAQFRGRYEAKQSCHLDFTRFPFDEQICEVKFYLTHDADGKITLDWELNVDDTTDVDKLDAADYTVSLERRANYVHSSKSGSSTGGVAFALVFKRVNSNIILHTYLPSILLSIASLLSVFVPSDLVPGRMGLCITAFLSTVSLFNGARRDWPQTAYMKAIDPWTCFCYLTSFFSLAEYCVVLYLTSRSNWEFKVTSHKKLNRPQVEPGRIRKRLLARIGPVTEAEKIIDANGEEIRRGEMFASNVEAATRIILPVYFLLFNVIYWAIVLS